MLLFLFFLPNFFVTTIGYCFLLLFASQVVVRYQYYHLVTSYMFQKQPPEIFYKNVVLQKFAIFIERHL